MPIDNIARGLALSAQDTADQAVALVQEQTDILVDHVFDGTTHSFDSSTLPTGYSTLVVELYAKTAKSTATDASKMTFNSDNAGANAHYPYVRMSKAGSGSPAGVSSTGADAQLVTLCGNAAGVANLWGHFVLRIPNHESNVGYKVGSSEESFHDGTNYTTRNGTCWWKSSNPITSIQLVSEANDNFLSGSRIVIKGIK